LIVNGDDFGLSREVNAAVIRAFKEGALTSCSLMVTGDAFEDALRLARENERLAVGIHLVTVMGKSVLPPTEIPHLVDEKGRFSNDPTAAGLKYYFSRPARRELAAELEAQFEKFRSTGLRCSHIDSHLHMHVHPVIFRTALKLGERHGVTLMRVPDDDLRLALAYDAGKSWSKAAYGFIFHLLTRGMKRTLRERKFIFTDRVYGNFQSGKMTEAYVLMVLDNLRAGAGEIYFHPALDGDRGMMELQILLSPGVKMRMKDRGIRSITPFELEASS